MSSELDGEENKKICLVCQRTFPADQTRCPEDGISLNLLQDPLIGKTFDGKYEILESVGGGGMGTVYRAKHKLMKHTVAIKVLHAAHLDSAKAVKRFQAEAQAASSLSMPNISKVYDFGSTETGQPYMVMDFLEGRPLSEVVEEEGPIAVHRFLKIFMQMARALTHAHERGVIHRDIKPSNIMLTKVEEDNDFVKLVDFGIAKVVNPIDGELNNLTRTGEVFGSAHYMSPEQCRGFKLDNRTDIYSLGVSMYFALTGRPVFDDDEFLRIVYKHVTELPASFGSIGVEVDEELEKIVLKCLAKAPDERYQTTQELFAALEQYKARQAVKEDGGSGKAVENDEAPPVVLRAEGKAISSAPDKLDKTLAVPGMAGVRPADLQSPEPVHMAQPAQTTQSRTVPVLLDKDIAAAQAQAQAAPLQSAPAAATKGGGKKKILVAAALATAAALAAVAYFAGGKVNFPAAGPDSTQSLSPAPAPAPTPVPDATSTAADTPSQSAGEAETLSGQYEPPSAGQQTPPEVTTGPGVEVGRHERLARPGMTGSQYPPASAPPAENAAAEEAAGNSGEAQPEQTAGGAPREGGHARAGARGGGTGRPKQASHGIAKIKNAIKNWWRKL